MACHYRVAVPSALVGQPEVQAGHHPRSGRHAASAAAGRRGQGRRDVRLRRTGAAAEALHAASSTRSLRAICSPAPSPLPAKSAAASRRAKRATETQKLHDQAANAEALAAVRDGREEARAACSRRSRRSTPSRRPPSCRSRGLQKEAELFQECLFSDQSKALIHVFFGERAVAKIPGHSQGHAADSRIKRAAVVGAGTMGGGITMNYANAGIPVLLKEVSQEALDRGLATINKNYAATVKKGRLTQKQMDERLA